MLYSFSGFLAALLSPLAMSIGFIIWGKNWKANSYSLNLYKCTLAGMIFMIVSYYVSTSNSNPTNFSLTNDSMIIVSSIIGIIIGDNTWLLALQMIGAKQVIIIDSLKPFCAAIAGYFILKEPFTLYMTIGLIISSIGIVLASTEKQETDITIETDSIENVEYDHVNSICKDTNSNSNKLDQSSKLKHLHGYLLAAINVILDSFGFIITKQFGTKMNTWDINFLRFGFAAIFMALLSILMHSYRKFQLYYNLNYSIRSSCMSNNSNHKYNIIHRNNDNSIASDTSNNHMHNSIELEVYEINKDNNTNNIINIDNDIKIDENHNTRMLTNQNIYDDWYIFPSYHKMKFHEWLYVSIGVIFVTFLCPAMSNYAIFQLPISLCLTLTSLGPIYSIPLVYIILGETSGIQSMIGSVLAVSGIAIMCI